MYCYYCGKEITDDTQFCPYCGKSTSEADNTNYTDQPTNAGYNVNPHTQASKSFENVMTKKDNSIVIIACVAIFAVLVIAGVSIYFINKKYPSNPQPQMAVQTMTPAPTQVSENIEVQRVFSRVPAYSPNYTYKNMNDIHTSVSSTDDEAFVIEKIIHEFDSAWIQYINNYDNTVFKFLREGTQAYNYAVKYGAKDLSEEYLLIDVQDVRKTNSYYYAWVHEVINEYSDKTERKEYHWVYKIGYDNGGYYIVDYTSDPAYK